MFAIFAVKNERENENERRSKKEKKIWKRLFFGKRAKTKTRSIRQNVQVLERRLKQKDEEEVFAKESDNKDEQIRLSRKEKKITFRRNAERHPQSSH